MGLQTPTTHLPYDLHQNPGLEKYFKQTTKTSSDPRKPYPFNSQN